MAETEWRNGSCTITLYEIPHLDGNVYLHYIVRME